MLTYECFLETYAPHKFQTDCSASNGLLGCGFRRNYAAFGKQDNAILDHFPVSQADILHKKRGHSALFGSATQRSLKFVAEIIEFIRSDQSSCVISNDILIFSF